MNPCGRCAVETGEPDRPHMRQYSLGRTKNHKVWCADRKKSYKMWSKVQEQVRESGGSGGRPLRRDCTNAHRNSLPETRERCTK